MLFIQGKNLYVEHPNKTKDILVNLNFHLNQDSKIGLIGENGSGKTTFLKLLQGDYKNFKGNLDKKFQTQKQIYTVIQEIKESHITLDNYLWKDHKLFDLKQKIYSNNNYSLDIIQEFQEFGGYELELLIDKTLQMFDLTNKDLNKFIYEFSGGEKNKISIIKSILYAPEFILFDEPINNLDSKSIEWFENYLRKINKPFIIVSHERSILDKCVNSIWEIENNSLNIYNGNYSEYKVKKEIILNKIKIKNNIIDKKLDRLNNSIIKKREKSNSFEKFKPKRSIKNNGGICKRDDGSGSVLNITKMMKSAIVLESKYNKLLSTKQIIRKDKTIEMCLIDSIHKVKNALVIENLSINFTSHSLKEINLIIGSNDKLHISGKNGSGKSFLLKILNGQIKNFKGNYIWNPQSKISYFSQEHEIFDFNKKVIEEVSNNSNKTESDIRNTLAYLDLTKEKIFNKISTLSLGERAKVVLAKIILSNSNVLILDEPTNHLDIKSREALENALFTFKGCIIFVSHDLFLTKKIANRFINIEDYII